MESIAPATRFQATTATTLAPSSSRSLEMWREQRQKPLLIGYCSPTQGHGRARVTPHQPPVRRFDKPANAATVLSSSSATPTISNAQPGRVAPSPLRQHERTQATPSRHSMPSNMSSEMQKRTHLQRLALSAIGYLESEKLQHPKVEPLRDPYPTATQPIPGVVWKLVKHIKNLPTNNRTGFPMRNELKQGPFRDHFHPSSGLLKRDSPLYRYAGNTTMFSRPVWEYLLELPKRARFEHRR